MAKSDQAEVLFTVKSSTFTALEAQADNGVKVNKDITTTSGGLYLDGDVEDAVESANIYNKVTFTDGRTVTAATLLTLESTLGASSLYLVNAGELTLSSKTGIVIHNTMTGTVKAKPLVINADNDSNASGTVSYTHLTLPTTPYV